MIINIAGTSGSGKSHLMRAFLDWARKCGSVTPHFVDGRTSPLGYFVELSRLKREVYVVGSYTNPTGGCDTIRDVVTLFDIVRSQHEDAHVLYEGLFVMNMTRGPQLAAEVGED